MCIVHAGFRGFRAFVARKKSRCKLIRNRFVIPHDTIHEPLCLIVKEPTAHSSTFGFADAQSQNRKTKRA